MKRTLTATALALSALIAIPAMAQGGGQAPVSPNVPNPSAPPAPEGPSTQRGTLPSATQPGGSGTMSSATMSSGSTMQKDSTTTKKDPTARSKKPREQGAPAVPTADAPSGPKGDSPDPAPGTKR